MFDDPKKELQALEGQLLAAEMKEEEQTEEFVQADQDPPIRNFANGYGRGVQPAAPAEETPAAQEEAPEAPPRSNRGLVILACVECVAIAALAVYWYFHFL